MPNRKFPPMRNFRRTHLLGSMVKGKLARMHARKTIKSVDKKVKRIQRREELKHVDTLLSNVNIPTTGSLHLLNACIQGDDDKNRIGRNITATSIQWRVRFSNSSGDLTPTVIRMIVFWDAQANGAVPSVSTLLDTSVVTTPLYAPYNQDYQKRYKVIFDRSIMFNPMAVAGFTPGTGATTSYAAQGAFVKKKRSLARQVKYDDSNNDDITDIQSNSLYALFLSDESVTVPTVVLAGFRFIFKDD